MGDRELGRDLYNLRVYLVQATAWIAPSNDVIKLGLSEMPVSNKALIFNRNIQQVVSLNAICSPHINIVEASK